MEERRLAMRTIRTQQITDAVRDLCMQANYSLDESVEGAIRASVKAENSPAGRTILRKLLDNAAIARKKSLAICQDTGMAVLFADVGKDLRIEGGNLTDALNEGVRRGYQEG